MAAQAVAASLDLTVLKRAKSMSNRANLRGASFLRIRTPPSQCLSLAVALAAVIAETSILGT